MFIFLYPIFNKMSTLLIYRHSGFRWMGECAILIGPLKRWNPFLQFILNSWQFFITLKNSL